MEKTVSCPFDLAKHPGVTDTRPNYGAFLRTFRREYGVTDPQRFYLEYRRTLMDRARPDPFGITRHPSLDEWWEAKVLEWRYAEFSRKPN
jgi:hypothetical protein